MAAMTLSKFSSGSPMPIITTLVMARSTVAGTLPKDLLAIQATACLGRNAQGAALALGNVHGLDAAAGRHAHHPLAGAVAGDVLADHFRTANFSNGLELLAQGLADVRHGVEIIDAKVVNPFHYLTGTETLLPD